MRLAVQHPVTSRSIKTDEVDKFVNDELLKVLRPMRDAVNAIGPERHRVSTDGAGTYARIWESSELPTSAIYTVTADVMGLGARGHTAERAAYLLTAAFSADGAVAQLGATTTVRSYESSAAIDARFGVDATARTVYVEVRDAGGGGVMDFTVVVTQTEGTQA